ncbi:MAG: cAMP-activated global transcriptional regulator CRP [Firmicutes bacterium ADurb.Bin506]|nr:MAG: cAMP-activated global transcriptional regulator CRP [Firmicutes bacterium ADurb.Bin506]
MRVHSCIDSVPMLRGLPDEILDRLSSTMRHLHFGKGQLIAAAGDPVDSLLIVASGHIRIVQCSTTGREQIIREAGPGEIMGEIGMFAAAQYEGDVIAADEAEACELPRKETLAALSTSPESAMILVEYLARRLARAEQIIGDLGARDVAGRLAAELVRAATAGTGAGSRAGAAVEAGTGTVSCAACAADRRLARDAGSGQVVLTGSWAEMAARIGTTPESLSRRLRALEDEGIIARAGAGGNAITVLDMVRLKEMAGMF